MSLEDIKRKELDRRSEAMEKAIKELEDAASKFLRDVSGPNSKRDKLNQSIGGVRGAYKLMKKSLKSF